jgi:hypothetical protein
VVGRNIKTPASQIILIILETVIEEDQNIIEKASSTYLKFP